MRINNGMAALVIGLCLLSTQVSASEFEATPVTGLALVGTMTGAIVAVAAAPLVGFGIIFGSLIVSNEVSNG